MSSTNYDQSNPALAQALVRADALASSIAVCSAGAGAAVQSSHLRQPQVPYAFVSRDLHPSEDTDRIASAMTWSNGGGQKSFEITREDDVVTPGGFLIAMEQRGIIALTETTDGGALAASTVSTATWKPVSQCLKSVSLSVGGVIVEKLRPFQIAYLQKHLNDADEDAGLGDGKADDEKSSLRTKIRYLSVPFQAARHGFPLAAVSSHKIEILVEMNKLEDCVKWEKGTPAAGTTEELYIASTNAFGALSAGSTNKVDITTFAMTDAVMHPVASTHVLCKAESDAVLAQSRSGAIAGADGSAIAGSGPLSFSYAPFEHADPHEISVDATSSEKNQTIIADSDMWSATPITALVLEVSNDAKLLDDDEDDPFLWFDVEANGKVLERVHVDFANSAKGSLSKQQLPKTLNGSRLYQISFESVSAAEQEEHSMPAGCFSVAAATHPRLVARLKAGAPAMKIKVHKQISAQWTLSDGLYQLRSAYQ